MSVTRATSRLEGVAELAQADHVCWVIGPGDDYAAGAEACVAEGRRAGDKVVVFGPEATLPELGDAAADPYVAALGGGPLRPDAMFEMFRRESAAAVAEGYRGVRVVADMDWLLAAEPSRDEVTAFELQLDALVAELNATVVCAYRQTTFRDDHLAELAAVHPHVHGGDVADRGLRIWRCDADRWGVAGEIDVANVATFSLALQTLARPGGELTLWVGDLAFIDVAGMSALADVAVSTPGLRVRVVGAGPVFRRCWSLAGFEIAATGVEFAE